MKAIGETCFHCADPDPYFYMLTKHLCGRCSISLSKNGVLPTTLRKKGKSDKKTKAISAILNNRLDNQEYTMNKRTKLSLPIPPSYDFEPSLIGYLPPLENSFESISDKFEEEDIEAQFPDTPKNPESFLLDLNDLNETESIRCPSLETVQMPYFY